MSLPAQTTNGELVDGLRAFGFVGPFSKKSSSARHPIYMRRGTHTLPIPNPQRNIPRWLLSDILVKAGIDRKEWIAARARKWKQPKVDDGDKPTEDSH